MTTATTINLKQILALVGPLDDSSGSQTSRERFRQFLKDNVREVGQLRDYVEECLRVTGDQYSRALQDLANHLGRFLGFDPTFGKYQGVSGQVGFDGHWASPTGFHIVAEVKSTEVYAVKTSTLVGYVDALISDSQIPNWDKALGLYVVGKPDPRIRQLENAIVAEHRTHQLRVVSVESLLSLAEMMHDYDMTHEDILAILRPSSPKVDAVVDLMARLVAGPRPPKPVVAPNEAADEPEEQVPATTASVTAAAFWLTPVASDEVRTAEEVVRTTVGQEHVYAFGDRTPGRKHLKPGDWICFYATGNGVVASARVTTSPENIRHPKIRHPEKWRWVFELDSVHVNLENPIVIDADLRSRLDAFTGRDPTAPWAWFVQATRNVTEQDFHLLAAR